MNKEEIQEKRYEISKRLEYLDYLSDIEKISDNKFTKLRRLLNTELHTLNFVLGYQDDLDSKELFERLENGDNNE